MVLALQISQAIYITKRRRSSRANVLTQQMMQSDATDVFKIMWIFIINLVYKVVGTTELAGSR